MIKTAETLPTQKTVRLMSLDVFRGLTVALMILVNTPGDWDHVYAPLLHSKWNGCTPTDVVFPAFLFMVGVSIVYALQNKREDYNLHLSIVLSAAKRMVLLIAFGLAIQLFYRFDFDHLRYPGVLQRIGITYFIVVLLYLKIPVKYFHYIFWSILIAFYLIMTFIPVPDGHTANLQPATNLAAYLDRLIFTRNHISHITRDWDAVGLLSTLPAISSVLFGVRAGQILKDVNISAAEKTIKLFIIGVGSIIAGLVWNLFFPINKQLWTSSYVLYSGGISAVALAIAHWFIDVKRCHRFISPAMIFGTNALAAYIVSEILPGVLAWIKISYQGRQQGLLKWFNLVLETFINPKEASLLSAVVFVILVWLLMYPLFKRRIFLKI